MLDGLSGIIGPNGCGKSNVVEALGWVMGENRPTAVRSSSMEDVIFAGSSTRPAKSFAEVVLEIDNSDRTAPAALNDSETLEISRRIDRKTGSVYRVNGRDALRRDIQILFADSASGSRSSALVKQGQINELINAKPSGRSRILEDAAGISGLFQRRHEAELKLNGVDANLKRAEDLLSQLKGRMAALSRQAKQAKRYRELAKELRIAEAVLLCCRWQEDDAGLNSADAELLKRTRDEAKREAAALKAEREREEIATALKPIREEAANATAALERLRAQGELFDDQIARVKRSSENLGSQIRQIYRDLERENSLKADAGLMISGMKTQLEELEAAASGYAERFKAAEEVLEESLRLLAEREKQSEQVGERLADALSRHQLSKRTLERAIRTVADCEKRQKTTLDRVRSAEESVAKAALNLKTADATKTMAENDVKVAEEKLAESERERLRIQEELAGTQAALLDEEQKLKALASEKAELENLLNGDNGSDDNLLDRVSVEPGFEAALGVALGDDLFAPEIGCEDKTGWASLLPVETPNSLPPAVEPLSKFAAAPDLLSRRLSQIGVAKEEEIAELQGVLAPGQRLVTKGGDLRRWDGFCVSGREESKPAAIRLSQSNRLKAVERRIIESRESTEQARAAKSRAAEQFDRITEADKLVRKARRLADEALANAGRELSQAQAQAGIAEKKQESFRDVYSIATREVETAQETLKNAKAEVASLDNLDSVKEAAATAKRAEVSVRMTMLDRKSERDELRREESGRMQKKSQIASNLTDWKRRLASASSRIDELSARQKRCKRDLESEVKEAKRLSEMSDKLLDQVDEAEECAKEAGDKFAIAEFENSAAERKERELRQLASQAREERARAEVHSENAKLRLAESVGAIKAGYYTDPACLIEKLGLQIGRLPPSVKKEIEVKRLRRSRDSLGAVNLRAEQDLAELKEELVELEREKGELEAAVLKLRSSIAKLNKDGEHLLRSAFEVVDQNFGRLFEFLFGGGKGRLELVQGDDPLDVGLEIFCHPPGKRFSTLSLLSGGEQTLTAVALVFAFFLAKPAPICVLDEVDAPLDDANIVRFCDLLDEITRQTDTRFLIVTHHPVTMSRMDRLFGITMQEKGVSKLVSVDLGEAVRMAA